MKHLRKFNESSDEVIKNDLIDITIDFSDRQIPVEVRLSGEGGKTICSIEIGDWRSGLDKTRIIPRDDIDDFLRIWDYLISNGYDLLSITYDFSGRLQRLGVQDIGLGKDNYRDQLVEGIDETTYLKLCFMK